MQSLPGFAIFPFQNFIQLIDIFSQMFVQIILDVPTVGGRLMLVDMAGSENIEQAGQIGFEAKMQVIIYVSTTRFIVLLNHLTFICQLATN